MFAFLASFVIQQDKRKELELFSQLWITRECLAGCFLKNECHCVAAVSLLIFRSEKRVVLDSIP